MEKKDVIAVLCNIATKVGDRAFKNEVAHDCFCGENQFARDEDFCFHPDVIRFIEAAVDEKLEMNELLRKK